MPQTIPEIAQAIVESISRDTDKIVKSRLKKAPFDKTYAGIISEILFDPDTKPDDIKFGQYKVRYGNTEKIVKLNDGLVHEIGERVFVNVFENNPNRVYIEPAVKYVTPTEFAYDEDTTSIIKTTEVKTNGQTYKIEDKYKLEIKNKDTKDMEVTQMTLPNGQIVKFKGLRVYF